MAVNLGRAICILTGAWIQWAISFQERQAHQTRDTKALRMLIYAIESRNWTGTGLSCGANESKPCESSVELCMACDCPCSSLPTCRLIRLTERKISLVCFNSITRHYSPEVSVHVKVRFGQWISNSFITLSMESYLLDASWFERDSQAANWCCHF